MNDAANHSAAPSIPLKIYLIAGEASGDLLGAHLIEHLSKLSQRPVTYAGVGGPRMAAQGVASLFPYDELSLMGFVEILPYAFNLMARINATVEDILTKKPNVVITIDSPGFCFRVVEKLRRLGYKAKYVHYVAPTVWAYKPERAERCAHLFDHLLVLLPFEPPYFENVRLATTFVGHPVVAECSVGDGKAFREKFEIAADTPLFCLLPGSRKGEIKRHMPIFGRAVMLLSSMYPNLAIAVAVPKPMMPIVSAYFQGCPFRAVIIGNDEDKKGAIAASNLAIAKSGTVALEVAMAGTPMVIAYRVHPISAWLLKRMCLTKFVNLINILQNRAVIPELLQEHCHPLFIATAAAELLQSKATQQAQKDMASRALSQLHHANGNLPSQVAAQAVLQLVDVI